MTTQAPAPNLAFSGVYYCREHHGVKNEDDDSEVCDFAERESDPKARLAQRPCNFTPLWYEEER